MSELAAIMTTVAPVSPQPQTSHPLLGLLPFRGGAMPELDTIPEIDAALERAHNVPTDERTELWSIIVDALLERRSELAK